MERGREEGEEGKNIREGVAGEVKGRGKRIEEKLKEVGLL